ncbi:MAG: hypothetical protein AB1696_17655 [Planctomycetota bacterium]
MSAKEVVVLLVIVALVLGGVGGYVAFVRSPQDGPTATPTQQGVEARPAPLAGKGEKENDYSPLWQTITRPPAAQPTQAEPPKPAAVFRLKGIVSQGAGRMAIIEDASGRQRLVGEGSAIDGARLIKISPRDVTIEAGGKTIILPLEPKAATEKSNPKGASPKPDSAK